MHRIVLSTFNPTEDMGNLEVNHKDEDKENNKLENLEWVTPKENCNYGTRNKRIGKGHKIRVRCVETGQVYDGFHDASNETSVSVSCISMCCTRYRNRKTAGGYHWEYAEKNE